MKTKKLLFFALAFMFLFSFVFILQSHKVSADLKTNLKSYWNLNQLNGKLTDVVNGYNATAIGNNITLGSNGKINKSVYFHQTNHKIENTLKGSFNSPTSGEFTLNLWMKPNESFYKSYSMLFTFGSSCIEQTRNYRLIFYQGQIFMDACGSVASSATTGNISALNWTMVTVVADIANNAQIKIYLNGKLNITASYNLEHPNSDYFIGSSEGANNNWDSYNGKLDEIGYWENTLLTSVQIQELYNNFKGLSYPFKNTQLPNVSNFNLTASQTKNIYGGDDEYAVNTAQQGLNYSQQTLNKIKTQLLIYNQTGSLITSKSNTINNGDTCQGAGGTMNLSSGNFINVDYASAQWIVNFNNQPPCSVIDGESIFNDLDAGAYYALVNYTYTFNSNTITKQSNELPFYFNANFQTTPLTINITSPENKYYNATATNNLTVFVKSQIPISKWILSTNNGITNTTYLSSNLQNRFILNSNYYTDFINTSKHFENGLNFLNVWAYGTYITTNNFYQNITLNAQRAFFIGNNSEKTNISSSIPEQVASLPDITLLKNDSTIVNLENYFINFNDYTVFFSSLNDSNLIIQIPKGNTSQNEYFNVETYNSNNIKISSFSKDFQTQIIYSICNNNNCISATQNIKIINPNELPPVKPSELGKTFITSLINGFLNIFPDSKDISLTFRLSFIFITILIVGIIFFIFLGKGVTITLSFVIFAGLFLLFFIFMGYLPLSILIITLLLALLVIYLMFKGGKNA